MEKAKKLYSIIAPTAHLSGLTQGTAERGPLLRALGVSLDLTEAVYPVGALWEQYKGTPASETMGKSYTGVQAWCSRCVISRS